MTEQTPRPSPLLYALAFGSGFAVLVIEIAGARVMAPWFGLSAVPWTAVIGVVLAALALGNHVGGRWADGGGPALPWILAVAGASAAVPVVLAGFPARALDALGFVAGAVASAVVLFALPVFALGMVVPYLVRAATGDLDHVGRRAGDVSAAATLGSILGTFTTGFVLLPLLPLPLLLSLTGAALLVMAVVARIALGSGPPAGGLVAVALALGALGASGVGTMPWALVREETIYSSIQVTEREWSDGRMVREMWQNGGSSSAEYVDTGDAAHGYVHFTEAALAAWGEPVRDVLVLGGAALTLPVTLTDHRPGLRVDVVEIDPAATRLAREHFAFGDPGRSQGIRVVHADARRFLRSTDRRYDVVFLDAFDNLVTVPWHLVTVEAFELARARLGPGGLFMANVLSPTAGPQADFLRRLLATAEAVFPRVRAWPVDVEGDPTAVGSVLLVAGGEDARLPTLERGAVETRASGPPLTDAYAPVEFLQARVFLGGLRWR